MKINLKNPLKIFSIWYVITFVLSLNLGYAIFTGTDSLETFHEHLILWFYATIINPLLLPLIECLVFLPTIIILFFLLKKIKNTNLRILLISFSIPFTNLIYFVFESLNSWMAFTSLLIGAYALFILLPLIFITTICTPKNILPIKWDIIKTTCLTSIFGFILVILSNTITSKIDYIININKLKKYEPLIQSIEELKIQNGTYPYDISKISRIKNDPNTYPYYEYIKREDNYILKVHTTNFIQFNYCSDNTIEECQSGWHNYRIQNKFGKWTRSAEDD